MTTAAESLIEAASLCGSVAVSGLAKNAGKTETLNFLLRGLGLAGVPAGVTSIGIDGESVDQVTLTSKPEITLFPGTWFATSETHYRKRRLQSEVLAVDTKTTPLGRVVFGRALSKGKVLLSGPSDVPSLKRAIATMHSLGARTVAVDGALSRQSLASPAVTEALVLATGAAVSRTLRGVADATSRTLALMALPAAEEPLARTALEAGRGVHGICGGTSEYLGLPSALSGCTELGEGLARYKTIAVGGAVTDRLLKWIAAQPGSRDTVVIARDFTHIFATLPALRQFHMSGAKLMVALRPKLLAVTVNPVSPDGYRLDAGALVNTISQCIVKAGFDVPVLDVHFTS